MTLDYPTRPHGAGAGSGAARVLGALCAVLRGVWAVLRLLAGALAALVGAAVGAPPAGAARLGHVLADEYRAGRAGAIDAEVIDDDPGPDGTDPTCPTDPTDPDEEDEPVKEGRR